MGPPVTCILPWLLQVLEISFYFQYFCFRKDKKTSFNFLFPLFFHSQKMIPTIVPDHIPLPSRCHLEGKWPFLVWIFSLLHQVHGIFTQEGLLLERTLFRVQNRPVKFKSLSRWEFFSGSTRQTCGALMYKHRNLTSLQTRLKILFYFFPWERRV